MYHHYICDRAVTTSQHLRLEVSNITASERPTPLYRAGSRASSEKHAGETRGKKCPPSRRDRNAKIAGHDGARIERGEATKIKSRPTERPPHCPEEASGTLGRLTRNRNRAPTGEKGGDACSPVITEMKQKTRRKASRDAARTRAGTSAASETRLVEFIQNIGRPGNFNQTQGKENTIIFKNNYIAMSISLKKIYSSMPTIANKRTEKY